MPIVFDPESTLLGRQQAAVERHQEEKQLMMDAARDVASIHGMGTIQTAGDMCVDSPGPNYTPVQPGGGPEFPIHDGHGPGYPNERY
jgi:hypothetical protein